MHYAWLPCIVHLVQFGAPIWYNLVLSTRQMPTCVAWLIVAQASIQLVEGQQQRGNAHAIKLLLPDARLSPQAVSGCPEAHEPIPALQAAQRDLPPHSLYFFCSW